MSKWHVIASRFTVKFLRRTRAAGLTVLDVFEWELEVPSGMSEHSSCATTHSFAFSLLGGVWIRAVGRAFQLD